MRNKKIVSLLTVAVLWLSVPFFSLPTAQAYHADLDYEITGATSYSDPFFGGVIAARENAAVTFNVRIIASETLGQRNLTVGVKFDWMTSWTNASDANPTSTLTVNPGQYVTTSVSVSMPAGASYNLYLHSWELQVWSDQYNMPSTLSCPTPGLTGCERRTGGNFAIYSAAQAEGLAARDEANDKIEALAGYLSVSFSQLSNVPPGWSKAAAEVAQASAELSAGHELYQDGDFANARTHYLNGLNHVNTATSALSSGGSGAESADFTNMILGGLGLLLGGTGIVLAGIGGLVYLNRRSKTPKA